MNHSLHESRIIHDCADDTRSTQQRYSPKLLVNLVLKVNLLALGELQNGNRRRGSSCGGSVVRCLLSLSRGIPTESA